MALQLYQENQDRSLKFGISDAQTYHWLHAMKELGEISTSITANDPLAVVFNNNDEKTYVAQNYDIMPKDVIFSDGFKLHVLPNTLATSDDLPVSGSISTPFDYSLIGNTIQLSLNVFNPSNLLTAVDFYNGNAPLAGYLIRHIFFKQMDLMPVLTIFMLNYIVEMILYIPILQK